MSERGVVYRIRIVEDKKNASVLKSLERAFSSSWKRAEKSALASQSRIVKGFRKATDAQVKDAQRLTKSTERMLGNREKLVTKSAERTRKQHRKTTDSILKDNTRESKADERKQKERERKERRTNDRIIRDRARASERLWKAAATPADRYRRKLQELERLARQGIGTEKQRSVAAARAYQTMLRENAKARGGTSKLTQLIQGQTSALVSMALGYIGIQQGITKAIALFREFDRVQQEAAERARQDKRGLGSLAQLAETPDQMRANVAMAKRIYAAGAATTLDQAGGVAFSIISAGAQKQEKLLTRMAASKLIDEPGKIARAGRTLISSMGERETGSFRDVFSKAFAASKFNPAEVEPLLEAASRSGGFARSLRLSDEEVLAATALRAEATGSAEQGGTQVRQMLKAISQVADDQGRQRFAGISLLNILETIRRETTLPGGETDIEALKGFLGGRAEATESYRGLILNRGRFGTVLSEVERAQREDLVGKKLALGKNIPEIGAAMLADRKRAERELSETQLGIRRNISDAVIDDITKWYTTVGRITGHSQMAGMANAVGRSGVKLRRFFTGDDFLLQAAAEGPPGDTRRQARRVLGLETVLPPPLPPPLSPPSIPAGQAVRSGGEADQLGAHIGRLADVIADEGERSRAATHAAAQEQTERLESALSQPGSPTTDLQPRTPGTPALPRGR